jgi:nucleotide-binding universal stress UspA family protein
MSFHRILVPIDGTAASRAVLPYLPALSASQESEVLLVRAVPFLATLLEMPNDFAWGPPSLGSDMSEVEGEVKGLVERLRSRGIRARGLTRLGSGAELVERLIRKEKIGLIALSSPPPSKVWHAFQETLPEYLLRHTELPIFVLNVRAPVPDWTVQFPWKPRSGRILVPVTENPASVDAVEMALGLARRLGVHVALEALADREHYGAETLDHLARGLRRCEQEHVLVEKRMARGDPGEVLLEESDRQTADLIALPPRLLPSPAADPLGSKVGRLLRRARVPLMFPGRPGRHRARSSFLEFFRSWRPSSPAAEGGVAVRN